jgi:hypothetical protein
MSLDERSRPPRPHERMVLYHRHDVRGCGLDSAGRRTVDVQYPPDRDNPDSREPIHLLCEAVAEHGFGGSHEYELDLACYVLFAQVAHGAADLREDVNGDHDDREGRAGAHLQPRDGLPPAGRHELGVQLLEPGDHPVLGVVLQR